MARSTSQRADPPQSSTQVALLRGINVGGKNKLPMADLAAVFVAAGCRNVRTYIQSGNVVFDAPPKLAAALPGVITAAIQRQFGFESPVIIRTAAEMRAVAAANPLLRPGVDTKMLHVVFLADAPRPTDVARLDPNRSPGDVFEVHVREVYLHLPNGVADSKLTNRYFDSTLRTVSTARNWATVLKLVELSSAS